MTPNPRASEAEVGVDPGALAGRDPAGRGAAARGASLVPTRGE